MRDALWEQYRHLRTAWADGLAWEFKRSAIAFAVLVLLAFGACMAFPALLDRAIQFLLDTMGGMEVLNEDGSLSAPALFLNNFQATAMTMTYGLLPFIQLPAMALGLNAVLLGILAAWYLTNGYSLLAYLAALLPHGVFELPALVFAFAVGLYVCGQLTRRCRRDENALSLWNCIILISEALVLVLLPLLLAAAVMEAYVTPLAAAHFL